MLLGHQASLEPATSPPRTIKKENTWPAGDSSNERVLAGTHWVTSRTLHEFPSGFKSRKPRGEKNLSLCPSSQNVQDREPTQQTGFPWRATLPAHLLFIVASHLADPGADCCGPSAGRISADIKAISRSWVNIQHYLLTGQPGRGKGWGPQYFMSRINPSVLAKGTLLPKGPSQTVG